MKTIKLIALIFPALFIGCTSDDENPDCPEVLPEEIGIVPKIQKLLGRIYLIAERLHYCRKMPCPFTHNRGAVA